MTDTPRDTGPDVPRTREQPGVPPPAGAAAHGITDGPTAPLAQADGTGFPAVRAAGVDTPLPPGTPAPAALAGPDHPRVTRAGMVWAAVASALVVLTLLIVFILQNQDYVNVRFFGLQGAVSLGVALFIAAVGGGVLVAIAGAARIIQLRLAARRQRAEMARRR